VSRFHDVIIQRSIGQNTTIENPDDAAEEESLVEDRSFIYNVENNSERSYEGATVALHGGP